MNELQLFLESPAGLALKGALVAAVIDFATGSFAAIKDGTFTVDALAAWVRKHLLGRVAPLAALLAGSYLSGDEVLATVAIGGLLSYAAETIASVKGNIFPPKAGDVMDLTDDRMLAVVVNPVPTD
jgi:hypothetical protein